MADSDVVVKITPQDEGTAAMLNDFSTRLGQLEQAFGKTTAASGAASLAFDTLGLSSERAAAGTQKFGAAANLTSKEGSELSSIAGNLARAMSAMGISGGSAAARLAALIGSMEALRVAAAPVLLSLGLMVAAFEAFKGVKDAISAASEWQEKMAVLGQTVKNQGGNWDDLAKKVQSYALVQEQTTKYSRTEAVSALTELTATGMKLGDAMIVSRVAEDAASATGRSLTEVNHGLMEAMHGRTQALTALGIGTKQSIHDGMTFRDILKAIEEHMGGAAATAADTYAGKMAQMQHALGTLVEEIGTTVLPMLTSLAKNVTDAIHEMETDLAEGTKAVKDWASQHKAFISGVMSLFHALEDTAKIALGVLAVQWQTATAIVEGIVSGFIDIISGNWSQLGKDLDSIQTTWLNALSKDFGTFGTNVETFFTNLVGNLKKIWSGLGSAMSQDLSTAAGRSAFGKDVGNINAGMGGNLGAGMARLSGGYFGGGGSHHAPPPNPPNIGGLSLGLGDTMVGGKQGGHRGGAGGHGGAGGSSYNPGVGAEATEKPEDVTALTNAHNALAAAAGIEKNAFAALALSVKASMDSKQLDAEKTKALQAAYKNAEADIKHMSTAVDENKKSVQAARTAYEKARSAVDASAKAIDAHKNSLKDHTKESVKSKEKTNDLANAHKLAEIQLTAADTALKNQTHSLTEHEKALSHDTKTVKDFIAGQQAMVVSLNDTIEKENESVADEKATYGKSKQELVKYYTDKYNLAEAAAETWLAKNHSNNDALLKDEEHAYIQMSQADITFWKDQVDRVKAAHQKMESDISTFLDDVLVKHKSFASEFKALWDKIVQDFIANIAKMIVEGKLFGNLFGGSGGGGGGGIFAGLLQLFTGGGGGGGTSSATSALASVGGLGASANSASIVSSVAGNAAVVHIGGIENSIMSHLVSSGGGLTVLGMAAVAGGALAAGGAIGAWEGRNSGDPATHAKWGAAGALLGVGAVGAGFALAAGLGLGGSGLALGTLLAAGPVGWGALAVGALVGGLAGGSLGPHWGPAENYPDRSDTQRYGTFMADITGHAGANGQQFSEESSVSQALGGKSELGFVQDWLAANKNSTDPATQALVKQYLASFGATGAAGVGGGEGGVVHGVHIGDLSVSGASYAGTYVDLQKALTDTIGKIQGLGAAAGGAAAAVFTITRSYPNFNAASIAGMVTPGSSGHPSDLPGIKQQPIVVNVGGSVVGPGGINAVVDAISAGLAQRNRGQMMGGAPVKSYGSF